MDVEIIAYRCKTILRIRVDIFAPLTLRSYERTMKLRHYKCTHTQILSVFADLPPGNPGTGSSLVPISLTPSLMPSFPLAAWDLKTRNTTSCTVNNNSPTYSVSHRRIVWMKRGVQPRTHCLWWFSSFSLLCYSQTHVLWTPSSAKYHYTSSHFLLCCSSKYGCMNAKKSKGQFFSGSIQIA